MRLKDKIAIITGAARGIGKDIAIRFIAEGAKVVIADMDAEQARKTAEELSKNGAVVKATASIDVSKPEQVTAMVDQVVKDFGRLDILVNNAGVGSCIPILEMTLAQWERDLRINLTGTFLCAQAAARVMVKQKYGHIVNIASISGQRGGIGRGAYGASKAGVILLTKVMAVELGALGVTVNAVAPGPVDTIKAGGTHTPATRKAYHERIALGRYGQASEIAAAVAFLASDDSSFMAGHTMNVDGGFDATGLLYQDEPATVPKAQPK